MRRVLVSVLLLALGAVAIEILGDLTQTRGDRMPRDSRSEVVVEVSERDYKRHLDDAGPNLIAACAGSMHGRILDDPGVVRMAEGRFRFFVQPALGPENHRKLTGCLEDFTIDRLKGHVVSVDNHGAADVD